MKLFLDEPESDEVRRYFDAEWTLVSASISLVEVLRAVRRAGASDEAIGQAREILALVHLRSATENLLARAATVAPAALRSLDALHLATALELSPPPAVFVCYDERLAAAARLHGLTVVAPGADEVHEP